MASRTVRLGQVLERNGVILGRGQLDRDLGLELASHVGDFLTESEGGLRGGLARGDLRLQLAAWMHRDKTLCGLEAGPNNDSLLYGSRDSENLSTTRRSVK
jgi:hypothetical protein